MQIIGAVIAFESARHKRQYGAVGTPLSVTVDTPTLSQKVRKGRAPSKVDWGERVGHPPVSLEPPVPLWTVVQSAMETVVVSVPSPEAFKVVKALEEGRKRAAAREQPIQDVIAAYKGALAEYERLALSESPSYSIIEIAKLKVADAFLESGGIPTTPQRKAG